MGRKRLTDEEKKKRGTFRADKSEKAYADKDVSNVVKGLFLPRIPEPELNLDEVGKKKYLEVAQMLLDQGNLTMITQMKAELAGLQWQKFYAKAKAGEPVTASDENQMQRLLDALGIAEKAPVMAGTEQPNKFRACGFANDPASSFRLLKTATAAPRKR